MKFISGYQEIIPLRELQPGQGITLAYETTIFLGWQMKQHKPDVYIISKSATSQEIALRIFQEEIHLLPIESATIVFDATQYQTIVKYFINNYEDMRGKRSLSELDERYKQLTNTAQPSSKTNKWFDVLKPTNGYRVTPILIGANAFIFILLLLIHQAPFALTLEEIIASGAACKPFIQQGQWWRLITQLFIHADFIQLSVNMYILMQLGRILEPLLGSLYFAVAFFLCGICGAVSGLMIYDIAAVGTTACIFGVWGTFVALLTTNFVEAQNKKNLIQRSIIILVINAVLGFILKFDIFTSMVGFASGLLFGYAFYFDLKSLRSGATKYAGLAVSVVFTLVFALTLLMYI
jgi:rhomboid protease GluP